MGNIDEWMLWNGPMEWTSQQWSYRATLNTLKELRKYNDYINFQDFYMIKLLPWDKVYKMKIPDQSLLII